jgi:hypothetical protein
MPTPNPIKTLATTTDRNPTLITHQEAGVIIIRDEAIAPLDLIPVGGVPQAIVQVPEVPVAEAVAVLGEGNVELLFNDY